MAAFIAVTAFLFVACYLGKGLQRKSEKHDEVQEIQCDDPYSIIAEKVDNLNRYKNTIETINGMIEDIYSCEPGSVYKTIQVKVLESGRIINILVDGEDDASEILLDLLEGQREEANTSLRKEIKQIS